MITIKSLYKKNKDSISLYTIGFIVLIFLIGCKSKEDSKTKDELYKSWEGIYTFCSYNKKDDKIYSARYTFIIDSLNTVVINNKQKEYQGEITQLGEKEITLNFFDKDSEEEYRISKNDSTFFVKGTIPKNDSLEIVANRYSKYEDYYKLRLSLAQISRIYKTEYTEGNARVNSKNGLVLRNKPTLQSEKLITIPYNTPLTIIADTDSFEYLTLGKNNKVVGRWIHVYFKDSEGVFRQGYVFDYFITYDYNIYNLPIDRSSEDPERAQIDIYNAKQFFENLGDMRTLNIKAKKIDLHRYLKNRLALEYDYDEIDFTIDFLDSQRNYGYFNNSVAKIEMFLQGYYDLEIRSDDRSELVVPPLHFFGCHGVLFNNVKFKTKYTQADYHKESGESFAFNINRTQSLFFSNVEFNNQQFKISYLSTMPLTFDYCRFKNYTKNCIVSRNEFKGEEYFPSVNIDNSYFWNNKLETFFELREEKNSIRNSFIGYSHFKNLNTNPKTNYDKSFFNLEDTYFTSNSDKFISSRK
ncbi:SH3 domain-containing protein [Tenacibaculum jejuense]|nr:SH3 domain-containing protein [Tenacibaculum jejuense]